MNSNKKFDNALDECLRRLLNNNETVEQCLKSYPEYSGRLKPLLETALAARKAVSIQPRSEFKEQARRQFQSVLRQKTLKETRSGFNWSWQPHWATAIAIFLVISLVGSGTVVAARGSMPDSPLYSVKQATEKIQLAITFSEMDKAELNAQLADERIGEIVYLADKGEPDKIAQVAENLNSHLAEITNLAVAQDASSDVSQSPEPEAMISATAALPSPDSSESAGAGGPGAGQEPVLAQTPASPPPALSMKTNQPVADQSTATTAPNNPNPASRNVTANNSAVGPVKITTPVPSNVSGRETTTENYFKQQGNVTIKSFTAKSENNYSSASANRRAQLKTTVENQATTNIARLHESLKTAPESSRHALQKTLEQSQKEYDKAVEALK